MIYTGLGRVGEIADVKAHGDADVAEVYGGINYQNPIFYSRKTLVGTSPLTFKALGQPLKDYHIFGETVQDGTPSPDYPVDVQGVGERTENLFDKDTALVGYRILGGYVTENSSYSCSDFIDVRGLQSIAKNKPDLAVTTFYFYDSRKQYLGKYDDHSPAAIPSDASYVRVNMLRDDPDSFILVPGTIAPSSYIPYGYKIPITIGNVTTPIYIGTEPLYRVGEYADEIASDGTLTRRNDIIDILADTSKISYVGWFRKNTPYEYRCFRFYRIPGVRKGTSNYFLTYNTYYDGLRGPGEVTFLYADSYLAINFSVPAYIDTVEKCIQWLTDIYESTGKRPVFVCPISNPTTEQVATPSLSTIVGDNTLTVDATVKPSAVSITGHIKPTGYGQLLDANDVDIQDSTGEPIYIQG